MVSYDLKRDRISIDGKLISPQRAEQISNKINKELKLRDTYLNSELYDSDITITNRTVKIICDEEYTPNENILVTIGFALDNDIIDEIHTENIIAWVSKWETHGDILVYESDVKDIFEKSNVEFTAFNVRYADGDITKKFKNEIENFNDI